MLGYANGCFLEEDKAEIVQTTVDGYISECTQAGVPCTVAEARYVAEVMWKAWLEHWNPAFEKEYDRAFSFHRNAGVDAGDADKLARTEAYDATNSNEPLNDMLREIEKDAWIDATSAA